MTVTACVTTYSDNLFAIFKFTQIFKISESCLGYRQANNPYKRAKQSSLQKLKTTFCDEWPGSLTELLSGGKRQYKATSPPHNDQPNLLQSCFT